MARRYFAPAEVAALERWPAEQQKQRFLQFWTLKEAYIKARGMGLSIPLADFAFALSPRRPPTICFAEGCPDDPSRWQFAHIGLGRRYQIALAVHLPATAGLTIRWRETVPLQRGDVGCTLPRSPANEWFQ